MKDAQFLKISTRLMVEQALAKKYTVTFYPGTPSSGSGIIRCEKGDKELFFKSTTTALTPSYGVFAAEDKVLTNSLLTAHNIAMPETVVVGESDGIDAALKLLKTAERVVVKPVNTNHGDGVSIGITSRKALSQAIAFARKVGGSTPDVLVQRQVEGDEYRFLVVGKKVIAVAGRRPPMIVGDGRSTVKQLIDELNRDPRRGEGHTSEMTRINLDDVIEHRGKAFLKKVVEKGESVYVLDTSNLSRGGQSVDFTDVASPALKKMAVQAAQCTFLGIAGVDIMTKDITSEKGDDSYVIEVNLGPGIRMHQFPGGGSARDVAKTIFRATEMTARTVNRHVTSVGRSEKVALPDFHVSKIPARIDTGATVSALWASSIEETAEGLSFKLFDKQSEYYTGETIVVPNYSRRVVSSSMGHTQLRYQLEVRMTIQGRRIRAKITLADRSTQIYPILIGRNILRNKFVVNVAAGKPLTLKEQTRRRELDAMLKGE
jgi:D-alanine-D-alanine ligase-like ATP-grasp enzyme